MQEIIKFTHLFLQKFCTGNQENQNLLNKHLNLFLIPGVSAIIVHVISFLDVLAVTYGSTAYLIMGLISQTLTKHSYGICSYVI